MFIDKIVLYFSYKINCHVILKIMLKDEIHKVILLETKVITYKASRRQKKQKIICKRSIQK